MKDKKWTKDVERDFCERLSARILTQKERRQREIDLKNTWHQKVCIFKKVSSGKIVFFSYYARYNTYIDEFTRSPMCDTISGPLETCSKKELIRKLLANDKLKCNNFNSRIQRITKSLRKLWSL